MLATALTVISLIAPSWAFTPTQFNQIDTRKSNLSMMIDLPPSSAIMNLPKSMIHTSSNQGTNINTISSSRSIGSSITQGIQEWLVPPVYAADKVKPPSDADVALLRTAFGAFYGERDPLKAEGLLSQVIEIWSNQPPDEQAALYRVRGDCYMELLRAEDAVNDYTTTLNLLSGPGGEKADPAELPATRLGRARALRSLGVLTKEQYKQAAEDYTIGLRLTSNDDYLETDDEREQDGASKNPYAAWEWGMARRGAGDYMKAAESHTIASFAFQQIGDRGRSIISKLDAGIDLAATDDAAQSKKVLESAIKSTTTVEGNDIELLQRVIAKEGEARVALASVLWSSNEKAAAETQLAEACTRLDQLQIDADAREAARVKKGIMPKPKIQKLKFSIDDTVGVETSCSRFKSDKFLTESLFWPLELQDKVSKLQKLK